MSCCSHLCNIENISIFRRLTKRRKVEITTEGNTNGTRSTTDAINTSLEPNEIYKINGSGIRILHSPNNMQVHVVSAGKEGTSPFRNSSRRSYRIPESNNEIKKLNSRKKTEEQEKSSMNKDNEYIITESMKEMMPDLKTFETSESKVQRKNLNSKKETEEQEKPPTNKDNEYIITECIEEGLMPDQKTFETSERKVLTKKLKSKNGMVRHKTFSMTGKFGNLKRTIRRKSMPELKTNGTVECRKKIEILNSKKETEEQEKPPTNKDDDYMITKSIEKGLMPDLKTFQTSESKVQTKNLNSKKQMVRHKTFSMTGKFGSLKKTIRRKSEPELRTNGTSEHRKKFKILNSKKELEAHTILIKENDNGMESIIRGSSPELKTRGEYKMNSKLLSASNKTITNEISRTKNDNNVMKSTRRSSLPALKRCKSPLRKMQESNNKKGKESHKNIFNSFQSATVKKVTRRGSMPVGIIYPIAEQLSIINSKSCDNLSTDDTAVIPEEKIRIPNVMISKIKKNKSN